MQRRISKEVFIGRVRIGGKSSVAVQSMTKVDTTDVSACVRQIRKLAATGCDLVRLAVPTKADTEAFARIVQKVDTPLIADIHFSADRAVEAIEAGAAKIRLNPGNIKDTRQIERVIDCARDHGIAVRIGVNEASIRDLKAGDIPAEDRVQLMVEEMKGYVRLFEKRRFENLVLSVKSASVARTIEANRAIAKAFDYPIHVGLTHAGLVEDATIPSSVALGALLAEGIGDTIRVSMAGDPVQEVICGRAILRALGLRREAIPELIVCPTCGRCQVDVVGLAREVRKLLTKIRRPIRVAVMGCIVNGPGEAADADFAVCAGSGKGYLYRGGKKIAVVAEEDILAAVQKELADL